MIKIRSPCEAIRWDHGNSFCGDVVLDSFNMGYMDEDSILYQIINSNIHIIRKYQHKTSSQAQFCELLVPLYINYGFS